MVPLQAARNFSPECRLESSSPLRVSLVNLQKLTFQACDDEAQHEDVGAGTEDPLFGAGQHDGTHFRVLEADALDGIVQFDVDTEIVGVEFQLVARPEPGILIDIQGERRHRPIEGQLPVSVAARMGIESDPLPVLRGNERLRLAPWTCSS